MMAETRTTNKLDEIKLSIKGKLGTSLRRNKSSIFSRTRGTRPTRNPSVQQRVADLSKGEIWTRDDFDEPLSSAALPGQKRVAGLNRGTVWTSDDFDEPL